MKVAFVQKTHKPLDDRVYYHQKPALEKAGCEVVILSAATDNCNLDNAFCFDSTDMRKQAVINKMSDILKTLSPDVMICDCPIAVIAAHKYKKINKKSRIVYDVTEFYPSKKNLYKLNFIKRLVKSLVLKTLDFYAAVVSDGLIFGEYYKSLKYKVLRKKPFVFLPYYPDNKYFLPSKYKDDFEKWTFSYNGNLTVEKGFPVVLEVTKAIVEKYPEKQFVLNVICGNYSDDKFRKMEQFPKNLDIIFSDYQPFETFCHSISDYDIFFDLRTNDKENTRCLPIKLFYYIAVGRPAVFTDLKAIRKEVADFENFGFLSNPEDINNIVAQVSRYISDNELYKRHCKNALNMSAVYSWNSIEQRFIDFITNE